MVFQMALLTLKLGVSLWTNNFEFLNQTCPKLEFILSTKFQIKLKISRFWKIYPKRVFPVLKNRFNKPCHWILHVQISLGIEFQFKRIILTFWTKLPKKGISSLKQIIANRTIEVCILVYFPNFGLNRKCRFFRRNLPKKVN